MSKDETLKQNIHERPLPPGWRWVKLGALMPPNLRSINPSAFPEEEFALYSIPAYDSGHPHYICGKLIGSNKLLLNKGDVLLSKIVPHIRRTWVVEDSGKSCSIGSTEWIVFRSKEIASQYLKFALLDDEFHKQFMNTTSGVGGSLTRARPSLVAQIVIPLPPLPEQQRIAAILREQMAVVEKARKAAQEQLEAIKSLPAALLRRAFSGEL